MAYHHGNLRQELLDAAAEAVEEEGLAALSLRALARKVGVSHGAPARHFPDKAALLTAMATEALARFRAAMTEAGEQGDSALERYRAMGRCYVHFAIENPAYFHIVGRPEFYSAGDEAFSRSYQEFFDTMSEVAADARREGGVEGLDPQAFLISTWAMAHGLATLWLDGTLEDRIGPVDIEAIAASAFDVVFANTERAAQPISTRSTDNVEGSR
ncbi:MAG: WHG domain-containing protein [bacterium]|nr:WHG domain-containing protein [bacterium]MCP5043906.1 WHG domain-containing protein [bacterium]